ncbi:MAG: ribbon-helix-helix protein, CopG family [Bryobacterales bacterium]|nr:ribbon-helix-helix protein, CopG family [Bryobacterales bacterium]
MGRSTRSQKARRLNAAYALLGEGREVGEAVALLSERFSLSRRQAYRYVQAAREMSAPVGVVEASVPITLKIPRSLLEALRTHARRSGVSMSDIASRALARFFGESARHG